MSRLVPAYVNEQKKYVRYKKPWREWTLQKNIFISSNSMIVLPASTLIFRWLMID